LTAINRFYKLVKRIKYGIMNIKRLLQFGFNRDTKDLWILLYRILIASFMLTHGLPKLERLLAGGEIRFGDPIGLGPEASLVLAVFAEFLCSILVGLGLGTRLASIPLVITMAVAAFISHGSDPFGRKELALIYLVSFLTMFFLGGGKFSLDHLINRKSARN
jgi:putative oxidoreductase